VAEYSWWGLLLGLKRVIVTPAVNLRLVKFLYFDFQSTGQKSHHVNTRSAIMMLSLDYTVGFPLSASVPRRLFVMAISPLN